MKKSFNWRQTIVATAIVVAIGAAYVAVVAYSACSAVVHFC